MRWQIPMFYNVCEYQKKIVHISGTRCSIAMGFWSKCSISNGQVIYNEKSNLNFVDMRLTSLDRVKYYGQNQNLTGFDHMSWAMGWLFQYRSVLCTNLGPDTIHQNCIQFISATLGKPIKTTLFVVHLKPICAHI